MALSDAQIERYSRQIIVPEIGGRGQERLLNSTLVIAGETADIEPALAYMVGAGVGTIRLQSPAARGLIDRIIAEMRALNSDASVSRIDHAAAGRADLILILAANDSAMKVAQRFSRTPGMPPMILARLDLPGKIAMMPKPPPCPACADTALLTTFAGRATHAAAIAMVAAVEAIKVLAGHPGPAPEIIEFDGYESRRRALAVASGARCPCSIGGDPGPRR